jgi:hypothetical protein
MADNLGMNATLAEGVVAALSGQAGSLGYIEAQVNLARVQSLNPASFGILPGLLVINPASLHLAASASADLANARAMVEYLVTVLSQEVAQQRGVSDSLTPADAGWFVRGPSAVRPSLDDGPTWLQQLVLGVLTLPPIVEMFQHPTKEQEEWIRAGGFARQEDGTYVSTRDAWQLWFGYVEPYDVFFDATIPMEREQFPFTYNDGNGDRDLILWGWKGNYGNLGAGGEMAMYEEFGFRGSGLWSAKYAEGDMPHITVSVTHAGDEITYAAPNEVQPWVATMNPYVQGADDDDLTVTSTITFPNQDMYDQFYSQYEGDRRLQFDAENNMVTVEF